MSACKVLETEDGMEAEAGKVYVAKGGYQLRMEKDNRGKMVFSVKKEPVRNGLRPCADVFWNPCLMHRTSAFYVRY